MRQHWRQRLAVPQGWVQRMQMVAYASAPEQQSLGSARCGSQCTDRRHLEHHAVTRYAHRRAVHAVHDWQSCRNRWTGQLDRTDVRHRDIARQRDDSSCGVLALRRLSTTCRWMASTSRLWRSTDDTSSRACCWTAAATTPMPTTCVTCLSVAGRAARRYLGPSVIAVIAGVTMSVLAALLQSFLTQHSSVAYVKLVPVFRA